MENQESKKTLELEVNKDLKRKYNKTKNSYLCTKCGCVFHDKHVYLSHLVRKTPCGQQDEKDILKEMQTKFSTSLQEYENTEKKKHNLNQLNQLIKSMEKQINLIMKIGEFDIAKQRTYMQEIKNMQDEIKML